MPGHFEDLLEAFPDGWGTPPPSASGSSKSTLVGTPAPFKLVDDDLDALISFVSLEPSVKSAPVQLPTSDVAALRVRVSSQSDTDEKHLAALLDLIDSRTSRTKENTSLSDTSSTREVVDAATENVESKPGTAVEPTDDFPAIVFPTAKEETKPRYPSLNGWATYETTNTRLGGKEEAAAEWKAPSQIKAEGEPVWTGFSKVSTEVATKAAAGTVNKTAAEAPDADKAVPLASLKAEEPEWKGFSKVRGQQLQRGSSAPNARTSSSKLVANGSANATSNAILTATSLVGKQGTTRLATAPRATTTSLPPRPTERIIEWKGFNEDAARGGFESIFKSERPVPAFPPTPLPADDTAQAPSKPAAFPPQQPLPSARTAHESVAPPLRTRIESSTRAIHRRSSFDEPPRPHPTDMHAMPPISIAGRAARDKERKEGGGHTLEPEMDIIHTSYQPKGWRTSRQDRATNGGFAHGRTGSEDDECNDEGKEDGIEEEESDEYPEDEPEPKNLRNEWEFEDLVDPYTPEPVKEEPVHPATRASNQSKKQDEPKFGKIDHGEIAPGWTPNIARREDLREPRETLSLRRFQESTAAIYASTTVLPDFIPEAPSHAPRRNRLADEADMGKPEPSHWVAEEEEQRYERRYMPRGSGRARRPPAATSYYNTPPAGYRAESEPGTDGGKPWIVPREDEEYRQMDAYRGAWESQRRGISGRFNRRNREY